MSENAAAKRQVGKQHIAVLLKEQQKDAKQGLAVRRPGAVPPAVPVTQDASTPVKGKGSSKFHGNQTANAQPQDGTIEIGLTRWRRP